MSWNKEAAVSYLRSHALGRSQNATPPLKFTGCIDEKDISIIRYVAGGM